MQAGTAKRQSPHTKEDSLDLSLWGPSGGVKEEEIMEKDKKYDVLLWDVDGTLLNFSKSLHFALTDTLNKYGLPSNDEIVSVYSKINDKCWKMLERGEVEKSWVLVHRFEELFEYLHETDVDVKAFQKDYQYMLGSVFYFQDNSRELLGKLKKDFKQYIVTNGVEDTQRRKLKLSGITDLVDGIFISECIGYEKPNPLFFEGCMEQIQKELGSVPHKSRILIIGDSLTSDMKGGNQFGIPCCYYKQGKEFKIASCDETGTSWNSETETVQKEVKKAIEIDGIKLDYQIGNLWEVEQILWQNPQTRN